MLIRTSNVNTMPSRLAGKSSRHTDCEVEWALQATSLTSPPELQESLSWACWKCLVWEKTPTFGKIQKRQQAPVLFASLESSLQMEWLLSLALPPAPLTKGDEHLSCKQHTGSSCRVAFPCKSDVKKLHKNLLSILYCACLCDGKDQLLKCGLLEERKAEELAPCFYLLSSEEHTSTVVHWCSQELNTEHSNFLLILCPLLLRALEASEKKNKKIIEWSQRHKHLLQIYFNASKGGERGTTFRDWRNKGIKATGTSVRTKSKTLCAWKWDSSSLSKVTGNKALMWQRS